MIGDSQRPVFPGPVSLTLEALRVERLLEDSGGLLSLLVRLVSGSERAVFYDEAPALAAGVQPPSRSAKMS